MTKTERGLHSDEKDHTENLSDFIFVLLYAPILTLVVLSFNNSRTRAKWGGFTTKWYVSMFENSAIMDALYNTLLVGRSLRFYRHSSGADGCHQHQ